MAVTDVIVIAVLALILAACIAIELWVRRHE